jgi:phage terminase small subunit
MATTPKRKRKSDPSKQAKKAKQIKKSIAELQKPKAKKHRARVANTDFIPLEARGLTLKQRLFCEEYLVDLNATQAAIRAGYSKATAHTTGSMQTANPKCMRYISHLKIERAKRLEVSQDRIVEELARIAYHDKRTFYDANNEALPLSQITDEQQTAIRDIQFKNVIEEVPAEQIDGTIKMEKRAKRIVSKYMLHNRVEALKMLGHHLGLSLDKPAERPPEQKNQELVNFETLLRKVDASNLELIMQVFQAASNKADAQRPKTIEQELMEEDRDNAIPSDHWSGKTTETMQ